MSASVNQTGDEVDNPFGDWNFVWLAYCDGSSQTSDRADPHTLNDGTTLHFRGRALLDAHLHELETQHAFLSTAEEVIISGTSADVTDYAVGGTQCSPSPARNCLTMDRWLAVLTWAAAAGARVVFTLNGMV